MNEIISYKELEWIPVEKLILNPLVGIIGLLIAENV